MYILEIKQLIDMNMIIILFVRCEGIIRTTFGSGLHNYKEMVLVQTPTVYVVSLSGDALKSLLARRVHIDVDAEHVIALHPLFSMQACFDSSKLLCVLSPLAYSPEYLLE